MTSGAPPEFWLYLPQMRMSFGTIVERARAAEQAGFDGIALMDHFAPPALPSADSFDAMTTASAIAARTTRLKISHLVLCSSFRHPCVLAKEMISLDHLSEGRFELGIGWGSVPGELERFGLPVEHPARRAARLEEYLKVFTALFTGEPVDFDGDFVALRGAQLSPRPLAGRIPVVIGGGGARLTMPLVARYADWWNCPGYAFRRFDDLRPLAGQARISTQHPVGLAADPADLPGVTALTQRRFGGWGGLIAGTAVDVAGALADLVARGVERFYLQFSDFGTPDTLARFGADVIPRLRAGAASKPWNMATYPSKVLCVTNKQPTRAPRAAGTSARKASVMPEPYPILNSLFLEQTGESSYRGPSVPSEVRPVVFGGQLMGQMIVAATSILPGKTVRSLHAIFARAGTVTQPVDLEVDVMHSGRALGSISVTAKQGDRLLSRGLLLLDAGEPDLIRHSEPKPAVAGPDETKPRGWEAGAEVRIVDEVDLMTSEVTGPPELYVWTKFSRAPDDQAVHQALLSWYTDPFLIASAMRPHQGVGQDMAHDTISTGVITHTLSFHEPVDATKWNLLANRSIFAGHGRTYGMGQVFTEDGQQVASYVQDNLVRAFRDEPGARGKGTLAM